MLRLSKCIAFQRGNPELLVSSQILPMTHSSSILALHSELLEQGLLALSNGHYTDAVQVFEQLTQAQSTHAENRLYLGLSYLLIGQEEAAQLTWALAFSEAGEETEADLLQQLTELLTEQILELEDKQNWRSMWLLCQYLHEFMPQSSTIILKGILAAISGDFMEVEYLENCGLQEAIESGINQGKDIDEQLLQSVLEEVILWDRFGQIPVLAWIRRLARYIPKPRQIATILRDQAIRIAQQGGREGGYQEAIAFLEVAVEIDENNFPARFGFPSIYLMARSYRRAITLAEDLLETCHDTQERLLVQGCLISSYLHTPEYWDKGKKQLQTTLELLPLFFEQAYQGKWSSISSHLVLTQLFYLQYVEDSPMLCREMQNKLSAIYCDYYQRHCSTLKSQEKQTHSKFPYYPSNDAERKPARNHGSQIRIGFISAFMAKHSIGWLSRWLFQHYDSDRFEIYTYHHTHQGTPIGISDFSHHWFAQNVKKATEVFGPAEDVAELIYKDEIDILVDLDSITSVSSFNVLALKPAPIQVTWLGYDASGLPTIDYFLADSFVLPANAENYYTEKVWRLPHSYIAVDGFEVGVPTLRRDCLNIPRDAVIYFSAQSTVKRHPEITQCQIQILKQVPNSYLLLKGLGDADSLQKVILELAETAGVSPDRFRFLKADQDEPTHRANMLLADVVLDTFPYTGATTTMEVLWLGIPLVTRVGEQFSSRNSYTMLCNAGITTGIAHSKEEYIEWGVRYGSDMALRQQVREQLRQSRQTAPLWNTKQFTRDMEAAFAEMWQRYCSEVIP